MNKDIRYDEIELEILNQKTSLKSIEVELKRMDIKRDKYLETVDSLNIKIAENEQKLAEFK